MAETPQPEDAPQSGESLAERLNKRIQEQRLLEEEEDQQLLQEAAAEYQADLKKQERETGTSAMTPEEIETELCALAKLPAGLELKLKAKKLAKRLHVDMATIALEINKRRAAAPASAAPAVDIASIISELSKAAEDLIGERDILTKAGELIEKTGLVGETVNAKLVFLAMVSRLLDWPVSVAVKGVSGGGKSHVVERVLEFFPAEAYSARTGMSEHGLIYSKEEFKHRVLVIFEAPGMGNEKDEKTSYFIRTLLSERRIVYETVGKNESGQIESVMIEKEGPTGIITTTTAASLHPENETRMLSLQVKDTPEQTKAILAATARKLGSNSVPSFDQAPWHAFQSLLALGERRVAIPYAEALSKNIKPVAVRLRRDFRTVLMLIKAHALLHRNHRTRDATVQIVATLDDYEVVRALISDALSEMLGTTVNATVRETVEVVKKLLDVGGMLGEKHASTLEIANALKIDRSAAKRRIQRGLMEGYLRNLETKPRQPSKIVMGADMPGDVALLPSVDKLRHDTQGAVENPCTSAPVADNPIVSDHILVQGGFAPVCTSEPASAPAGALDATGANGSCTSTHIETSGEFPTGALVHANPTPPSGCRVSGLSGDIPEGEAELKTSLEDPQPESEVALAERSAGTVASVPFMITKAMKETLGKAGYSEDRIRNLTPQEAHRLIDALPAAHGLQWPERSRMIELGHGETELRGMSTADARRLIKENGGLPMRGAPGPRRGPEPDWSRDGVRF
jgi:hypothetical protein